MAKKATTTPALSSVLILSKFILNLFGCKDFSALSENLRDHAYEGWDENGNSYFYHQLVSRSYTSSKFSKQTLLEYDENITRHTKAISARRAEPVQWKYFQYLALLFTEIYLDKYFSNPEELVKALNDFKEPKYDGTFSYKDHISENYEKYSILSDYKVSELNKLALWNATGSGKTLLMHINILQYKHYLAKHGRDRELNKIIVLTPNEGLSHQHLKELKESGFEAEIFSATAGSLFSGSKVEIIDIHKLEETSGNKTFAIESFEGNNLVLVDEGHRGSGGEVWKEKRSRLCEGGFSFEYSATFGQAVASQSGKSRSSSLLEEYAKATLFDYSYKYFYGDGYGKDYHILNVKDTSNDQVNTLYLTACLLAYYEQVKVFKDPTQRAAEFQIEKPLAVFVGKSVTATKKNNDNLENSDVIKILAFLSDFIKNEGGQSVENLNQLLNERDELRDGAGNRIFRRSFKYLKSDPQLDGKKLFESVLNDVFNSSTVGALLHIDGLKGQDGEIGLRVGDSDYFGVINVGDSSNLLNLCEKKGFIKTTKDFASSLFKNINSSKSTVNVLIGSKKFSEGWSSWRVSTMGLMNIGQSEGSEIIQLFGRGVRLKGYKTSLKRSSALDTSIRPSEVPKYLSTLETLNIFGIKANYMQRFKDYLEQEGLKTDTNFYEVSLPVTPKISIESLGLKYLKVKDNLSYKTEQKVSNLTWKGNSKVVLNWYSKIEVMNSRVNRNPDHLGVISNLEEHKLDNRHLAFIDWDRMFFDIENFKAERSWHNLTLSKEVLSKALTDDQHSQWYTLYIPNSELELTRFSKVRLWQEVATALLKGYIEKVYNFHKSSFYSENMDLEVLNNKHPNFIQEYKLSIDPKEESLIRKIEALKSSVEMVKKSHDDLLEFFCCSLHLYQPLLYVNKKKQDFEIITKPQGINKGERDFVQDLVDFTNEPGALPEISSLYFLRNLTKSGVGFFEANNFYPDFILWLTLQDIQHIVFIDPKGLRQVAGFNDPKFTLNQLFIDDPKYRNLVSKGVKLHSFIVSNTPFNDISHWGGQNSIQDFNERGVFFQFDQKSGYVKLMIDKVLEAE